MKRCLYCEKLVFFWQEKGIDNDSHFQCHFNYLADSIKETCNTIEDFHDNMLEVEKLTNNNYKYGRLFKVLQLKATLTL